MDDPVGQGAASFAFGPVVAAQFGRRMLRPAEGRGRDLFAEVLRVATSVHLDDRHLLLGRGRIDHRRSLQLPDGGVGRLGLGAQGFQLFGVSRGQLRLLRNGLQLRVSDEEQVAADAVAAVRRDQGQRPGVGGHRHVERDGLLLAQLEPLELDLVVDEDGEVGLGLGGGLGGAEADDSGQANFPEAAEPADPLQVEGDAAVGVQAEQGPSFGGIVDAVELGAALTFQRAVGDGVPGVSAGLGQAFEHGAVVQPDVGLAVGEEDAEHARRLGDLLQDVGADVPQVMLLLLGDLAVAAVDA